MNTLTPTRQQIIDIIDSLLEDAFSELASFVGYLRYKSIETKTEPPHNSFLLSIAGLGASNEKDVSERDEKILANEVNSIRGWSSNYVSSWSAVSWGKLSYDLFAILNPSWTVADNKDKGKTSRHGAVSPDDCIEMGKKYEWKLKDIVLRTDRPILKMDCVFEDDTEFPSYGEKENE